MPFCSQEQAGLCKFLSNTFLCLCSRNGEDQVAQMESRNANRGSWKRKLKITEQLKENKRGFIRNNSFKREKKKKKQSRLKKKEDARAQKQARWESLQGKPERRRKGHNPAGNGPREQTCRVNEAIAPWGGIPTLWRQTPTESGLAPRPTLSSRASFGEYTRRSASATGYEIAPSLSCLPFSCLPSSLLSFFPVSGIKPPYRYLTIIVIIIIWWPSLLLVFYSFLFFHETAALKFKNHLSLSQKSHPESILLSKALPFILFGKEWSRHWSSSHWSHSQSLPAVSCP